MSHDAHLNLVIYLCIIFNTFRESKWMFEFSDVVITSGENHISAHRVILAAHSDFFRKRLTNKHSVSVKILVVTCVCLTFSFTYYSSVSREFVIATVESLDHNQVKPKTIKLEFIV